MALIEFPFSRTTAQRVRGGDGYLKEYGVDDPAFEFNGDLTYRGLRFEPQVTNYITQSNNFPDTVWYQSVVSWLSGIPSVENQNTAYKMREDGTIRAYQGTYQQRTLTPNTYTWSIFAKKSGDRSRVGLMIGTSGQYSGAIFNLDTGLVTSTRDDEGFFDSANIEPWIDGWYRVSITFTITGTLDIFHRMMNAIDDTTFQSYNSTTNYGVYIFGAQGKAGDTAGSYVETGATSASSTSGFITKSGLQDYLGQNNSGGNFYVNFEVQDVKQGFLMSVKNLSNATKISLFLNTGNTCTVQVSGQSNYSYTVNLVGSKHKIAVSYVVGDQRLAYNGQVVDTQTVNITDNTVLDAVEVGGFAQGVLVPDVNVRGMAFGTETLSNNKLSNITRL
jgi:hypothetical protein